MKILRHLLCGLFVLLALGASADNKKPIQTNQLPAAARQFIERYFAQSRIMLVTQETDFAKKSYDVVFDDGCKLEFDGKGDWKEIDCKFSAVPESVVPKPIAEQVRSSYPDAKIVKIDKDRREYEVKLSNRMELTFDLRFNLIDIDY